MPGTGYAGPVYLASAIDGAQVAVRLLRGTWTHDPAARDRFAAEASSADRVPPFSAARIVDAGVADDRAYLVSEFVAGRSLLESVSDDGPFRGPDLEALAIGCATGLASVHQAGLVHGNFGPEYVIMSPAGPRVIEYGITPPYGPATPSADMLAWAQTMVFAAIARPPETFADLDALPVTLRQTAADCLSGDPVLRPTAKEIVAALLDEAEPSAGVLAAGTRRAAQAAMASPRARPVQPAGAGTGPHQARPARQPGPDGASAHRSGHGRAGVLPVAAAVVVIAVIAFVVVHLLQSSGGGQAAGGTPLRTGGTTGSATAHHKKPTSPPAPSDAGTVPDYYAGSWSGQARQLNPPNEFTVTLRLSQGSPDGRITYSGSGGISCVGDLSLQTSTASTVTLSQGITTGRDTCANGQVTLSQSTNGTLQFTFHGKTGPDVSGTLTRA